MRNPYLPLPMRVENTVAETLDGSIRTLSLSFTGQEDGKAFSFVPGQFVQLSLLGIGEAPFGIASAPDESGILDFTVSRAGLVTTELHNLEPGDRVGMRGPLGNGYPLGDMEGKNILVVGGGFGFSTLRAFTGFALEPANRSRFGKITVVYGSRNPGMVLYRNELEEWSRRTDIRLLITVDRGEPGWRHRIGMVPEVVGELEIEGDRTVALVCGPPGMIRHVLPVIEGAGVPPEAIHLSLEMKMKCGVGRCGRCNIGEDLVCVRGPVFSKARLDALPGEYLP